MSEQGSGGGGGGDLGRRLAEDVLDVGRQELGRVREDLIGEPGPAATGAVLLAAAGAAAVLGSAAATVATLRLLELVLPRRLAALALTGGYLLGSAVLIRRGLERLEQAGGGSRRLADQARQGISASAHKALSSAAAVGDD